MERHHIVEQLLAVVDHYPLDPGDTISHEGAKRCAALGLIVRQADGKWIPTAQGLWVAGLSKAGQETA